MPVIAASVVGGVQALQGGYQAYQGYKGLKNLSNKPYPQYSLSPQLSSAYNAAQQNAQRGYSPQQTAAFQSELAQNNNAQYQKGVDRAGGSLSGAIQSGINYGNIGALNKFASNDASLQAQHQNTAYGLAGQIQNQQNMATQAQLQQRQQLENSYGSALRAGLSGISQGIQAGTNIYGAAKGWFNGAQNKAASPSLSGNTSPNFGSLGTQGYAPQYVAQNPVTPENFSYDYSQPIDQSVYGDPNVNLNY